MISMENGYILNNVGTRIDLISVLSESHLSEKALERVKKEYPEMTVSIVNFNELEGLLKDPTTDPSTHIFFTDLSAPYKKYYETNYPSFTYSVIKHIQAKKGD